MRHNVIVFDFDGTLVDSNEIKTDGFAHAFADRSECVQAIPEILASHKSLTRHEIIASLVGCISYLSDAQRAEEARGRTHAYSAWVESRIIEKAAASPAGSLLRRWQTQATLYICSLTPREYLKRIVEGIGWLSCFEAVEGYPLVKHEMLVRTAARHAIAAHEVLMVGDSNDDEDAAATAATAFFRIRNVGDLNCLDRYLQT